LISAATRVAALIGSPVQHSLSPALHNAGFAATGADWVYTAFDVALGDAGAALDAMRVLGFGGLSVTMPHKDAVAALVDELDPAAAALRSVNTVVPIGDGRLKGYSTDGAGFIASLSAHGLDVADRRVCVFGAGGAARAIIDALARAGAKSITVINRSADRARAAASLAGAIGSVGDATDIGRSDFVINATSVGMGSATDLPCDAGLLHAGLVVADIVYHPRRTAFLDAADRVGARTIEGLGMLVHQAVLQQELWTGLKPDATVMSAAAERQLAVTGK
jgi:shikimate dehydrogenase